jgi:hypothetical protein
MQHVRRQQNPESRYSKSDSGDGIDYVRCRVCGAHLSVISGRHLSKHGIDRHTYMQEYRLKPGQTLLQIIPHKSQFPN